MKALLESLLARTDLSADQAEQLLLALVKGPAEPAMIAAILTALRAKGESASELLGFARAMLSLANVPTLPTTTPAIDIVGTGGDRSDSINISTAAALLVAACGVPVIKHGNRSISSRCGSADVLAALGLPMPMDEATAAACLQRTGFTFLFAPHYHPAAAVLAPVRKTLGIRTIFNVLGPLTNPARPPFGLIGAYSLSTARLMAQAFAGMSLQRVMVICGHDAWDEATPIGPFTVIDVHGATVSEQVRSPHDYNLAPCTADDLRGGDAPANAEAIRAVFRGANGPHRDAIVLNAALALECAGIVKVPSAGIARASKAIDDGSAASLLHQLSLFGESHRTPARGGTP